MSIPTFLGLSYWKRGSLEREMTNPFTGEKSTAFVYAEGEGATSEELASSAFVLDEANACPTDADGWRTVALVDGSQLSVRLGQNGGQITVEGEVTSETSQLIYQVANACRMYLTYVDTQGIYAAVPPASGEAEIDDEFIVTHLANPAELLDWIHSQT